MSFEKEFLGQAHTAWLVLQHCRFCWRKASILSEPCWSKCLLRSPSPHSQYQTLCVCLHV